MPLRRHKRDKHAERQAKLFNNPSLHMDTWTCHICLEERPENKIAVLTKPVDGLKDLIGVVTQNVRYCNDRPECYEGAKTYSHFHLHGEETDA